MKAAIMQAPPAIGEECFPVCPTCGRSVAPHEDHDCDEMGGMDTLSVEAPETAGGKRTALAAPTTPPKPAVQQLRGTTTDELRGLVIDGRYEVLEKSSQGGMGTVYQARHVTLRNLLAVKILRKPKDEVSRRRFLQEAQLLSQIKHPNIVQVIDFGELPDGKSYLAMEFLQGPTLTALVREGQLTPLRACKIAAQIARGMHHVHDQGIVHRDLNAFSNNRRRNHTGCHIGFAIGRCTRSIVAASANWETLISNSHDSWIRHARNQNTKPNRISNCQIVTTYQYQAQNFQRTIANNLTSSRSHIPISSD